MEMFALLVALITGIFATGVVVGLTWGGPPSRYQPPVVVDLTPARARFRRRL